ncbi:hypothetical protein MtrunA17_Chr1g0174991 [Medicago truncatula]|uniref:Uncharacterized protein n=1 Tax=Medicago truncatula TaxID=3880 RepID=A0A396JPV4_MEDTR|nr:hypothetical protein MtrunA17_Chr1g0174991 [Medicago truncatula]
MIFCCLEKKLTVVNELFVSCFIWILSDKTFNFMDIKIDNNTRK